MNHQLPTEYVGPVVAEVRPRSWRYEAKPGIKLNPHVPRHACRQVLGHEQVPGLAEADEAGVKRHVVPDAQQQAVEWVETFPIVGGTPWLDVGGPEEKTHIDLGDSTPGAPELVHCSTEFALPSASGNDGRSLGGVDGGSAALERSDNRVLEPGNGVESRCVQDEVSYPRGEPEQLALVARPRTVQRGMAALHL